MDAAQSFEYKLTVHQLRPWPLNSAAAGGPQFIAIGWQRGKQTGAIDAVKAKVTAKGYGVYMFNEDLTISANLRKNPGGAPGFEKKFLQLAAISVHRGMTEDRPIASLGTVVINLADFTDVKRGPKKLAFRVSVGREVTSALSSIGKPEAPSLIVTMQAVKRMGGRTLERDMSSFSSRGSRITGDLSAFFGKDKHSAREPVPEEEEHEPVPTGIKPPGTLESFGAASDRGSTPGLPPSDLRATPANPARAVDSDGFEVDSSEDAVAAAAQRPVMPTRKPSFLNNTSGGAAQRDAEAHQAPKGTPPPVSSHHKKSFSMLEEMNARKNRVSSMLGEPSSADPPVATPPVAEPAAASPQQQFTGPRAVPAEMDSEGATPESQPPPAAEAPAPAARPEPEDDAAPRRKTGKTTYIRDWLGSAEPAPGEGPSIRFPKAADSPDAKPVTWLPSTLEEEGSAMAGSGVAGEGAAEEPGRRQLAQSLSVSRTANHDLRMVLDQDRIHKEGESFMKDLDDVAAAAAQAAEEMEEAPILPNNGHRSSGSRTGVQDTPGGASSGASDDADGSAAGKRRFAWQRKRGSVPEIAAVPEDRSADEVLPREMGGMGMHSLGAGVESMLQMDDTAGAAATEDMRRIEADTAHAERIAEHELRYAEAERRTQEAEDMAAEAERQATEAERRASAAEQRANASEQQAAALKQQVAEDAQAADTAEQMARARLDALLVQVQEQEAAVDAAKSRAAEAEAEARKHVARQEEVAADVVLESVAASSSIALETGPLDGASTRMGAAPRKAGKELKWRRASHAGSAALNTAHSTVVDDADQKLIERLEHELCIVGVLETAVHCCACFHKEEGVQRSRSHITHTPARRLFRALISMPQEQAGAMVPQVLQAIRCRTQKQWADDVPLAFFWWSNMQMLRVFLHQLENGSVATVGDCAWLPPMLAPGLQTVIQSHEIARELFTLPGVTRVERKERKKHTMVQEIGEEIFNGIVSMLWTDVMLPMQERSAARKSSSDNTEEEAMMRWMASLEVANDRVSRALLHIEGFSALLLPLVQVALLARIDFLFYSNIMAVGGEEHPQSAFGGGGGWAVPPHMLPFSVEGRVSFQTGMQLKMAVMHMSHWAHDHDLRDKNGGMLYPFMRGTADVLMMKKDLLLDDETRLSVASALPVPALLHLLSHFAPDEFSPDEVDPAVLQELREVAAGLPDEMGTLQAYAAPCVEELQEFADREISEGITRRRGGRAQSMAQVSVQIGDDSDAELQALTEDSGDPSRRFKLVQEMWGAAHDRRDE